MSKETQKKTRDRGRKCDYYGSNKDLFGCANASSLVEDNGAFAKYMNFIFIKKVKAICLTSNDPRHRKDISWT